MKESIESNINILGTNVADLSLSLRCAQAFEKQGIRTFSDILAKGLDFYTPKNGFDVHTKGEIIKFVKSYGYDLN